MPDKIFLTFGTSDPKAGSNPYRHSFFILSRLQAGAASMKVFDTWGFTAVPSRAAPNSLRTYIKKDLLRFNYDMYGNHGILCHEQYRYLDVGDGLHGKSFEISQENCQKLQEKCSAMVADQNAAIAQAVKDLNLQPKLSENTKVYEYEDHSQEIYNHEINLARKEQRLPRLRHFEFPLFSVLGSGTNTCKTQIVHLFDDILAPQQIARITNNGMTTSFPLFSGITESIHLYSTGPLSTHVKASGATVHFRDNYTNEIGLDWTIPPTLIETFDEKTKHDLHIDPVYVNDFKKFAKTLQALYWFFLNTPIANAKQEVIDDIQAKISGLFKLSITTKNMVDNQQTRCMHHFFRSSKVIPMQNRPEAITNIEDFFNTIYETAQSPESLLSEEAKIELCKILGRPYSTPTLSCLSMAYGGD